MGGLVIEERYHFAPFLKLKFRFLGFSIRVFTFLGFVWKALVTLK